MSMLTQTFLSPDWLMTLGERCAYEGLLQLLKPSYGIEIGVFKGSSLRRLVANCLKVHAFDLVISEELKHEFPDVHFHVGRSQDTLPNFLATSRAIDNNSLMFALVDGDHSTEAVRDDISTLISSLVFPQIFILVHDAAHPSVRDALESLEYSCYEDIIFVDHDFYPGHIDKGGSTDGEIWGGFSLIIIDRKGKTHVPHLGKFYSSAEYLSYIPYLDLKL